jgi:hypothetical protein
VPADASEALEEAMNDALPHLFETAPDLLYQLVTMVSPVELKVITSLSCRVVDCIRCGFICQLSAEYTPWPWLVSNIMSGPA